MIIIVISGFAIITIYTYHFLTRDLREAGRDTGES